MIKEFILHRKQYKTLKKHLIKAYFNENIIVQLNELMSCNFKLDKAGRLYTIINPKIQNMEFDTNSQILEFGIDGLNNNSFIKQWANDRIQALFLFASNKDLLDIIDINIELLQPEYAQNFLLTLTPKHFHTYLFYKLKIHKMFFLIGIIGIIATLLLIFL